MRQQLQQELIELTCDLIRIPSCHSKPWQILECAKFIVSWFQRNNIEATLSTHSDVPAITVLPQPENVPVLLLCHFDVVEAESAAMYTPQVNNGNLLGRGAIDDKYGVALSMILFREHLQRLQEKGLSVKDMSFGLLLTGDEELGGRSGTGRISESLTPEFFIALDGGNPQHIITREKGILLLELIAEGNSSHAARPWLGENAFDLLIKDYQNLKQLFPSNPDGGWKRTMVLSHCRAGNGSTNMVPGRASCILDIRYTENDDPEELLSVIREVAQARVEVLAKEPVFSTDGSPWLDLLQKEAPEAVFSCEHGASDARYFGSRGIPGAIWGAEGEMSQHTEEEHLVIDSMFTLYKHLDSFLGKIEEQKSRHWR